MGFLEDAEARCSRQTPRISQGVKHNIVGKKKSRQAVAAALLPSCSELRNSSSNRSGEIPEVELQDQKASEEQTACPY